MLTLPIKKKWFDLILSGEKKEEYREATDYYYKRFTNLFNALETDIKEVAFRNGYSSNSPLFVAKCTFHIKTGKPEWGAKPGKEYYTLKIHEVTMKAGC
ncbi:MAG: ASCH domain-containing protein [Vallitaleaceae bacterium]|nr:ASCH domain-containing protein [Vallitaleaceae bacterium]